MPPKASLVLSPRGRHNTRIFFLLFGSFLDHSMSEIDASIVSSLQSALATHISLFGAVADRAVHKTRSLSEHQKDRSDPYSSSEAHMSLVHHSTHYMPMTNLPSEEASALRKEIVAYLVDSASQALFTVEHKCFIIDTGASVTITNCASDYAVPPRKVHPTHLQGIASGLLVQGIGTATYHFRDDKGAEICLELNNVLFVPDYSVRLLCPRHIAENTGRLSDGFNSLRDVGILTIHDNTITIPYQTTTGLPVVYTIPAAPTCYIASNVELPPTPLVGISANLSPSQRTKLILHEQCNHVNFETINRWICKGVLPIDKSVANSKDPICAACQFGKANKRAHKADVGSITAKHTTPGQGVSVDLLEAGIPGRLPTTRGLPSPKWYRYVTLWVDHYSRYLYPTFHETKGLNAALASKREFEARVRSFCKQIWCQNCKH